MATEHNKEGDACSLCVHARDHGWWGRHNLTHCRECGATWSLGTKVQHCTVCHHSFSSESTTRAHVVSGKCVDPATAVHPDTSQRAGEPIFGSTTNGYGHTVWRLSAKNGAHAWRQP